MSNYMLAKLYPTPKQVVQASLKVFYGSHKSFKKYYDDSQRTLQSVGDAVLKFLCCLTAISSRAFPSCHVKNEHSCRAVYVNRDICCLFGWQIGKPLILSYWSKKTINSRVAMETRVYSVALFLSMGVNLAKTDTLAILEDKVFCFSKDQKKPRWIQRCFLPKYYPYIAYLGLLTLPEVRKEFCYIGFPSFWRICCRCKEGESETKEI